MRTIEVKKERLLKTLKKNRKKHKATFDEAQIKYREKVIAELNKAMMRAKAGGKIQTYFAFPAPEDYTDAYDTAISMVEWAEGETIELDEGSFKNYVLDEWGWKGAFVANTASYLSS